MDKDHYDQAATVFSPDGRVYQVEYAREAIKRGGLALGMVFDGGVLFTIDKSIFSPLIEEGNLEKFFKITPDVGAAASGLIADARVLIDILREKAQEEARRYGEVPDIRNLVMWISRIYEIYTRYEGVRPFGTALIIGGKDPTGYHLYETDPSGVFQERGATAIGKGAPKAVEILEKSYRKGLKKNEAVKMALDILTETMADRPQDDQKGEEIHILTDEGFERLDLDNPEDFKKITAKLAKSKKKTTAPKKKSGKKSKMPGIEEFLDSIPKLSPEAKRSIIEKFKDLNKLKKAYFDELVGLKGVGKTTAERIIKALEALK
jgi:proteasome alpha subunit